MFPVDGPPLEHGVVEIRGGQITAVGSDDPGPDAIVDRAIIPGLVNAHTHLEFSDLGVPLPADGGFSSWIRRVIATRGDRTQPVASAIRAGLRESAGLGTTLAGEIATNHASVRGCSPDVPRCVVFRELLGRSPDLIAERMETARRHLDTRDASHTDDVLRGLSPHAPYSVHPDLFGQIIALARTAGVPVAMHVAESREERELVEQGTGPLVELLASLGVWTPGPIAAAPSIRDVLVQLAEAPRALVVHGNDLKDDEIDWLATQSHLSVVYCPRTHAHFAHPPHPWRTLISRGVTVALGTDSRASNPDLSLFEELRHLRRTAPEVSADVLLRMGTYNGAQALGLPDECGTITVGKRADLAIVRLAVTSEGTELSPGERLLHPDSKIVATIRNGRWIAGESSGTID